MNENQPEAAQPIKVHLSVELRDRMVGVGIPRMKHNKWAHRVITGRIYNMARQQAAGEAPTLELAGMPKGMGNALDELAERRGLESVSELAEGIFREVLEAESIAITTT